METVKDIAAILGCILSLSAVFTLCSKSAKEGISRMFAKYGNNKELDDIKELIEQVSGQLETHIMDDEVRMIKNCRRRIVRFADELRKGNTPDIEYTRDVLDDVDTYEKYCIEHPTFPNSQAVCAIDRIKQYYNSIMAN